jgi:PAS domain S-box-containing protein
MDSPTPESILNSTLLAEAWTNAELAMLVVDDDGHYIATNKSALELTGYTHHEVTQLRAGRDLAGDAQSAGIYEALARGRRMRGRKLVRRKDGRLVSCRYWGVCTTVAQLPYFILLLRPADTAS